MKIAVQTKSLHVHYETHLALWDINLELPSGQIIAIIGPNGAGKSTLLKSLLGLSKISSGKISFFEESRSKIAYVPQRESVDWQFPITVEELVVMGAYKKIGLFKFVPKAVKVRAREVLDRLEMLPYKDRQISKLSGGQQQRVFLARALMQEAEIYFLDEPFAGIDFATAKRMWELFKALKEEGKTIIVVHHDLSSVKEYFDYVVMLNKKVVASGPVSEVFTRDLVFATYGRHHDLFEKGM